MILCFIENQSFKCDVFLQARSVEGSAGKSQNTFKRVLPLTPSVGELPSSTVALLDRNANSKQNQAYSAFFLEYSLISE